MSSLKIFKTHTKNLDLENTQRKKKKDRFGSGFGWFLYYCDLVIGFLMCTVRNSVWVRVVVIRLGLRMVAPSGCVLCFGVGVRACVRDWWCRLVVWPVLVWFMLLSV